MNQVKKQVVRQDLIKQAVLGNDEILRHKAWKKGMAERDLKQDKTFTKQQALAHEQSKKEAFIEDKKTKQGMNFALKEQWFKQQADVEAESKEVLKMEKKMLSNASQFDG